MRGLWYDRSLNYSIFHQSFFRAHGDVSAFCLALRLTLGVAVAYQSEIPVSIRVLADVLEGHVSPLEEVLVSFVLEGGEGTKISTCFFHVAHSRRDTQKGGTLRCLQYACEQGRACSYLSQFHHHLSPLSSHSLWMR